MNIHEVLSLIIQKIDDIPIDSHENIYRQLEEQCCDYFLGELRELEKAFASESEPSLHNAIELKLKEFWLEINRTVLAYTAIHHHPIVPIIYDLACYLSTTDACTPPRAPLEFMMPGVSLISYDLNFPSWGTHEATQPLSSEKELKLAELSSQILLAPLLPEDEGVYLTLKTQREAYDKEQEYVQKLYYLQIGRYLIPKILDCRHFFAQHVLCDNGKSIIPISVLLSENGSNPYGTSITVTEKFRMAQHSPETSALTNERHLLHSLKTQDNSLLGQLEYLCQQLRCNDSHVGIGTHHEAASGAYIAILRFYEYYQYLSEEIRQQIPVELREELDYLIKLSCDHDANQNAVENINTCIAKRRSELEKHMSKCQTQLQQIAISTEDFVASLNQQKGAVKHVEERLKQQLETATYTGKDRLPITLKLIEAYDICLNFHTHADLQTFLLLPIQDALLLARGREQALLRSVMSLQDLVLFMTDTPLALLENFVTIFNDFLTQHLFLSLPQNTFILLTFLDEEKFHLIFNKIKNEHFFEKDPHWYQRRLTDSPDPILYHFAHSRHALLSFIELIPQQDLYMVMNQRSAHYLSLLHRILFDPILVYAVLSRMTPVARMTILSQQYEHGYTHIHTSSNHPELLNAMFEALPEEERSMFLVSLCHQENEWNNSPFHLAAASNSLHVLKLLFQIYPQNNHIDMIRQKNINGLTPLDLAILKKNIRVVQYLLSYLDNAVAIIELRRRDKHGRTMFHHVIHHIHLLSILLRASPQDEQINSLTEKDLWGDSPWMLAIRWPQSVHTILLSLSDGHRWKLLNYATSKGITIMHSAASNGAEATIRAMISYCSNTQAKQLVMAKADADYTPLHYAALSSNPQTISLLLNIYDPKDRLRAVKQQNQYQESPLLISVNDPKKILAILTTLPPHERLQTIIDVQTHVLQNKKNEFLQGLINDYPLLLAQNINKLTPLYRSSYVSQSQVDDLISGALRELGQHLRQTHPGTHLAASLFFKQAAKIAQSIDLYLNKQPLTERDKQLLCEGKCKEIFDCSERLAKPYFAQPSFYPRPPSQPQESRRSQVVRIVLD